MLLQQHYRGEQTTVREKLELRNPEMNSQRLEAALYA